MQDTQVWSLGWEDPLEKSMATHSSILAWRIPWTEKLGWLQFMRLQRVRHDWENKYAHMLLYDRNQHNFVKAIQFSCSVMSTSLQPHGLQHTRPPCPSPTPWVYSNSSLLSWWCHPTISSSVVPSPPAFNLSQHQGLFKCQFFASGGQGIEVSASASVPPMNIQDWFPSGWTGWISL